MTEFMNIEEIKQKTFRVISQDGIDKILAGIVLMFIPLTLVNMAFLVILVLMMVLSLVLKGILRKKFVQSRVGYAKFSARSDRKEAWFTGFYLLLFLLLFFVMNIIELKTFKPLVIMIIPAGVLFATAHFRTKMTIDYIISLLVLLGGVIGLIFTLSGYDPGTVVAYQFGGLGIVFLVIGVIQLVIFLRKYPRQDAEMSSAC